MLEITVVDKDKVYELSSKFEHAHVFFIPREDENELSHSYVAKRYKYIAAGRKSSNEILLVYDVGSIELHTSGFYNVIRNADEKETIVQDNVTAAKEWITIGKALFSIGVAHVFIDSVNYVVTMYVSSHYAVRVGNLEAFVVL